MSYPSLFPLLHSFCLTVLGLCFLDIESSLYLLWLFLAFRVGIRTRLHKDWRSDIRYTDIILVPEFRVCIRAIGVSCELLVGVEYLGV
jgi:hypothetical protein